MKENRIEFMLRVQPQSGGKDYSFALTWEQKQVYDTCSVPEPKALKTTYDCWQHHYLKLYCPDLAKPMPISGGWPIYPSGDRYNDVEAAEEALSEAFLNWLGRNDIRRLERLIEGSLKDVRWGKRPRGNVSITTGVDIYVYCEGSFLEQLPWEIWADKLKPSDAPLGTVQVIRTIRGKTHSAPVAQQQLQKPRILSLMTYEPNLPNSGYSDVLLNTLGSVATVEFIECKQDDIASQRDKDAFRKRLSKKLSDSRGWDALFYFGHSDKAGRQDGVIRLAPDFTLSISDIQPQLKTAYRHGLRLAVFNSCVGTKIATNLLAMGIQSVAMREPINSEIAIQFVRKLTQVLVRHENIHEAIHQTRAYLQAAEDIRLPSAHLIPSLFGFPQARPVVIRPYGWKSIARRWVPTRKEAIALGSAVLISQLPFQSFFLDIRYATEALYRDVTRQNIVAEEIPPALLVQIDQESVNQAINGNANGNNGVVDFSAGPPMDREYLANIVNRLIEEELISPVIGVNYILHSKRNTNKHSLFVTAMANAIEKRNTRFVLAARKGKYKLPVAKGLREPDVSLQGDVSKRKSPWDIDTTLHGRCHFDGEAGEPKEREAAATTVSQALEIPALQSFVAERQALIATNEISLCQFSYVLAFSHYVNQQAPKQQAAGPQATDDETPDQANRNLLLESWRYLDDDIRSSPLDGWLSFLGFRSVSDLSIEADNVYDTVPAWKLLNRDENPEITENIAKYEGGVVMITSGSYVDVEDEYLVPLSFYYRCYADKLTNWSSESCVQTFSGGEMTAYQYRHAYHWIDSSAKQALPPIRLVPELWMITLGAIAGKWTRLKGEDKDDSESKKLVGAAKMLSALYVVAAHQAYVSLAVCFPCFLPTAVFLNYLLLLQRSKTA